MCLHVGVRGQTTVPGGKQLEIESTLTGYCNSTVYFSKMPVKLDWFGL